ncbi:MAG: hypothetical protein LBH44_13235 [Treponema sp.]|nr:hypothetical protein [Treponema sp.]
MNKRRFLSLLLVYLICLGLTSCEAEIEAGVVTDLWEQIRNTAWTKDGDTKPSIGFYGAKKGPHGAFYVQCPYLYFGEESLFFIQDSFEIDKTGKQISCEYNFEMMAAGISFKIFFDVSVSGNGERLTISKSEAEYIYEGESYSLDEVFISNGTYSKISSDPDYDWFNNNGDDDE